MSLVSARCERGQSVEGEQEQCVCTHSAYCDRRRRELLWATPLATVGYAAIPDTGIGIGQVADPPLAPTPPHSADLLEISHLSDC